MTREQLLVCMGNPDTTRTKGKYECLVYNNRKPKEYYIKDDVLAKTKK